MSSLASNAQVNIYASDPEVLACFYKALGFAEKFRFPSTGKPDQVEVSVANFTLGFTSKEALERLAGLKADSGPPQNEIVLWCEDAPSLYTKALDLGARSVAAPRIFNDRICSAWVLDLEGNRVKLVSLLAT